MAKTPQRLGEEATKAQLEPSTTTVQIFLSYAREDREKVESLYKKLSNAGFNPWMDTKDILPGERWESSIPKAVRSSDFFLACLSAKSVSKRGWIQKEIKDALDIWREKLDSDIYLIPVRLEDCEAPESLGGFQWVDLFEEDGWMRLVEAILEGMKRRGEAIQPIVQESTPSESHPAHEKPPTSTETVIPEKDPERVRGGTVSIGKGTVLLKKYKILRPLGSGALGDVYLAEDRDLERKVAVKHLKPEYAADGKVLERFRREARTIANLRHPNIAVVHGLEQEDGQSYIILEYAEKGTLADLLATQKGPLPIIQAVDLTIALCHALAAVHRRGIFHRDIKPGNILLIKLEDKIVPRLSDFGLSSASKSGVYLGIEYAPPEQLMGDPVDARSDIYSLGMVLYEMLAGKSPFAGSVDEILRAQLEQEPPLLRSIRKEVLPSLEEVVLKAISRKPEDRYETTKEMAKDLERALQEELEKQEKVRDLYAQADQYMRAQNWLMAIEKLEAVSALNPNYEDTAQWLAEARKQLVLKTTYEQGWVAFNREDWNEAEVSFKKILDIDESFRDTADKLKETNKQIHLLSFYTEAKQLGEMKEWSEAIKKYAQIIATEPSYKDAAERMAEASERNRLQLLYDQASALFAEKNWQGAAEKFGEVLDLDPYYEDVASKAEEAEKHALSQTLYAEGMEYLRNCEWQRAIDTFEKIRRSDPGYEAVDARLAEAERQKRLQDLYDEGMACRGRKDWQRAIEKFTQLLSENPEHPTAATLLEEAKRRKTQKETRRKLSRENPIKAWWSSQDSTVKAAWIGAAALLLATLCGILDGSTTLEVARHLVGMNPTPTPTPAVPAPTAFTPTSTPYPAPTLSSPDEGISLTKGQDVKLAWEWERNLEDNEFFEVRIRLKGAQEFDQVGLTKMSYRFVSASKLTQVGTYEWQVAIVSPLGEEKGVSQIRSFEVK